MISLFFGIGDQFNLGINLSWEHFSQVAITARERRRGRQGGTTLGGAAGSRTRVKPHDCCKTGAESGRHTAMQPWLIRWCRCFPETWKSCDSIDGTQPALTRGQTANRAADRKRRPLVTLVCRRESRGTTQPKWLEASLLTLTYLLSLTYLLTYLLTLKFFLR